MKTASLLYFGCGLVAVAVGCIMNRPAVDPVASSPGSTPGRPVLTNGFLLELVTIMGPGDRTACAMLHRQEVADALGADYARATATGWAGLAMDRGQLLKTLQRYYTGARLKDAEAYLAAREVRRPYTLNELGVKNSQDLLDKFFVKRNPDAEEWFLRSLFLDGHRLRESDFLATLKGLGFEITEGDVIPMFLVRPPSTVH
jgi:hypothetical protein